MWELILEWCADLFGATVRSRLLQLVLFCCGLFVLGLALSMRWGMAAWAFPALMIALSVGAARQVAAARDEVWRAACGVLREPRSRRTAGLVAPTASTLFTLAEAVDAVRRGSYVAANELVPQIRRDALRPEELQLLDAVRAMISMGLGSTQRAAQQAVAALPTGSEELDACLGRTVITDAWNDPARLTAIHDAWDRAGIADGPLSRLRSLVRIRLDVGEMDRLGVIEARQLSDEARAIGDDTLASELDARSRPNAYR